MLIPITDMLEFTVEGLNGPVGRCADFLFEPERWTLRYAAVDLDLDGLNRTVLLPIMAARRVDIEAATLHVGLDSAKIADSPDVARERSLTKEMELDLHRHFDLQPTWQSGIAPVPPGTAAPPVSAVAGEGEVREQASQVFEAPAATRVLGAQLRAKDGELGKIRDMMVDSSLWEIRYLIVSAEGLGDTSQPLIAPTMISDADWEARRFEVDERREVIEQAPRWQGSGGIDSALERRLEKQYRILPH